MPLELRSWSRVVAWPKDRTLESAPSVGRDLISYPPLSRGIREGGQRCPVCSTRVVRKNPTFLLEAAPVTGNMIWIGKRNSQARRCANRFFVNSLGGTGTLPKLCRNELPPLSMPLGAGSWRAWCAAINGWSSDQTNKTLSQPFSLSCLTLHHSDSPASYLIETC
jgi:hypothetical protein